MLSRCSSSGRKTQGVDLSLDEETGPLVVSICARLDGMPLAIELAAARLRSLSLASLHDRLDQRFRLLTGGSRTALERQQTLGATVDWSYSLLNGAEQLLLRRLSVFAESFDLDAAEAVCGFGDLEAFEVTGLLGSLVDKSLVVAEPTAGALRYRLLETIRQFAAERLAEAAEDEAAAVAAAHCAVLSRCRRGGGPSSDRARPGQMVRTAGRRAGEPAPRRRACRPRPGWDRAGPAVRRGAAALLDGAFSERGSPRAARAGAGAARRPRGSRAVRGGTGHGRDRSPNFMTWRQLGSWVNRRLSSLASTLTTGCSSIPSLSSAVRTTSPASLRRGYPWGRRLSSAPASSATMSCWAQASWRICCAATSSTRRAPNSCSPRPPPAPNGPATRSITSLLHNNAGVHALRAGDIPAARAHLEQAAQAMQAIGDKSQPVSVNLGWVLRQESDPDAARSMFEPSLRISRRNGERSGIAYATLGLASVAADLGDRQRAAELHGVAQAFLDQTGEPWQEPEARYRRDSLNQVRTPLGEEQFDRAYAKGMTLSPQALDLALGKLRPA